MRRLLAYIGRFFHGIAPQKHVETIRSYAGLKRVYSRTDKGVNAVANPVEMDRDVYSDFVVSRGSFEGRPKLKEYRYFISPPKDFEEFLSLLPRRISGKAFVRKPRKERREIEVIVARDHISFIAEGFEQYAIRRLLGYYFRRRRGIMSDQEVYESLRGNVKRYPPLAPAEPLALWRTDVEQDDGNRSRIELRISSRCSFWGSKLIKRSKRLIKQKSLRTF